MDPRPQPGPPDPTAPLPGAGFYQLIHTLRPAIPPISNSPEDIARRDHAIIAHVAALQPANIAEASLAALHVTASTQALACARLAHQYANPEPQLALKCATQATSMLRQARALLVLLLRVQAARQDRDEDATTREAAAATQQRVIALMSDALADALPAAAAPPPPPPKAQPTAAQPVQAETQPAAPAADIKLLADAYARAHGKRAALIRKLRRLPRHIDVGPLLPAVINEIITGDSPVLRALDKKYHLPPRGLTTPGAPSAPTG